jgi:endonuclease YncB( thermonuclease family)
MTPTCDTNIKHIPYVTPTHHHDKVAEEEEEEEEEEEGLFKADAVNEEDPERDRATQV